MWYDSTIPAVLVFRVGKACYKHYNRHFYSLNFWFALWEKGEKTVIFVTAIYEYATHLTAHGNGC